ncbi:MAG: beta-N-acetylhexosaminidase [Bacteroidia bacterium]|nr:beta-N-acetylhexosaminidase [Bacteroidia bacterium]
MTKKGPHFIPWIFRVAGACLIMAGCTSAPQYQPPPQPEIPTDLTQAALIPYPVSVAASGGVFHITGETRIYVTGPDAAQQVAQALSDLISPAMGTSLQVMPTDAPPPPGHISLTLNPADIALGEEGYQLSITPEGISLSAPQPVGLFWGVQTLRQLMPVAVEARTVQAGPWIIPTGTIRDYPDYAYRGSMLDVARHFFGMDEVKRYIDFLALYKLNTLHLHLSDDQGWRIEIKSWPNLTAHGGSTEVGGGEGGFFTQEQYKELVRYAQARYITLIPEIDMPGHTNSALASYPELNCDGKAPKLYTGTNVGFSTLCTDKEVTYAFIDSVVREISALTPGPYFHIGGDESHATKKEDYIPFVNRVTEIVLKHGKQPIGWDETAQANINNRSVIQLWASAEYGQMGVGKGASLIMSPANKAYMDMQYDSTSRLGLHWAAYIEVDSGYSWNPATRIPGIGREHILGIEAPLWSETISTLDDIEYLTFPRLPGYAEIGWSPDTVRNWEKYRKRLAAHGARFKAMEIDYYPSPKIDW